jgi:hypothetical protein
VIKMLPLKNILPMWRTPVVIRLSSVLYSPKLPKLLVPRHPQQFEHGSPRHSDLRERGNGQRR